MADEDEPNDATPDDIEEDVSYMESKDDADSSIGKVNEDLNEVEETLDEEFEDDAEINNINLRPPKTQEQANIFMEKANLNGY